MDMHARNALNEVGCLSSHVLNTRWLTDPLMFGQAPLMSSMLAMLSPSSEVCLCIAMKWRGVSPSCETETKLERQLKGFGKS